MVSISYFILLTSDFVFQRHIARDERDGIGEIGKFFSSLV